LPSSSSNNTAERNDRECKGPQLSQLTPSPLLVQMNGQLLRMRQVSSLLISRRRTSAPGATGCRHWAAGVGQCPGACALLPWLPMLHRQRRSAPQSSNSTREGVSSDCGTVCGAAPTTSAIVRACPVQPWLLRLLHQHHFTSNQAEECMQRRAHTNITISNQRAHPAT
jgi:hypothetical protein